MIGSSVRIFSSYWLDLLFTSFIYIYITNSVIYGMVIFSIESRFSERKAEEKDYACGARVSIGNQDHDEYIYAILFSDLFR